MTFFILFFERLGRLISRVASSLRTRQAGTLTQELVESGNVFHLTDQFGKSIFISHRRRRVQYPRGVDYRLEKLLGEYSLSKDFFTKGPIVDVGANVGEIGIIAWQSGAQYFAFEPDPIAFEALEKNVPGGKLFPIALSNISGVADFGLKTESADSSLLLAGGQEETDAVRVRVARLDDLIDELGLPEKVALLKLEAEGNEPEVLKGAPLFLDRVAYCAVDAGPERFGEPTAVEVTNLLFGAGFELRAVNLKRGTFLFANRRMAWGLDSA